MISSLLLSVALSIRPHSITPGVVRPEITQANVCTIKWGRDRRHVTAAMAAHVYAMYGVTPTGRWLRAKSGKRYYQSDNEVDHLISRELGGADDELNLWIEPYEGPWNARMKDRLENRLHVLVCNGQMTLEFAQEAIATDWIAAYRLYVVEKPEEKTRSRK